MKKQVRTGVFETNSSSTHAVTIITDEEYQLYKAGKLHISRYAKLATQEEYDKLLKEAIEKAKTNYEKSEFMYRGHDVSLYFRDDEQGVTEMKEEYRKILEAVKKRNINSQILT